MIYHEYRLNGVHPMLAGFIRLLCSRLSVHHPDWLIVCGWRGETEQHEAFLAGRSKVDWPNSQHNRMIEVSTLEYNVRSTSAAVVKKMVPQSVAVDLAPYPYDAGRDKERLYLIAGYARCLADVEGVPLRIGADWDGDLATLDQKLHDPWHYELKV